MAANTGANRYQNNSNFKNKSMSQPTGYPGQPILNALTPDQQKLEVLRQHFPQAIEVGTDGHIRINAAALQLAVDPSNPAGIQVEEDGYELRWVGKREAYHSACSLSSIEIKITPSSLSMSLASSRRGYIKLNQPLWVRAP